jgi:hypothetical protein
VTVDAVNATTVAGGGGGEMRALAEDALTLIQPQSVEQLRARLPRGPVTPDKVLIVECWEDCYPYRVMARSELQNHLLALYGPGARGRIRPEDVSTISFGDLDAWLAAPSDAAHAATAKAVEDAQWVIFALAEYNPVGRPVSGAAKRFLDAPPVDLRNKNLIGISYNVPYHLDSTEISKLAAYFVVYNKTDAAIDTGFRALFGEVTPKGHSPVNVTGIFYNVADAVQAAPDQQIAVAVFGQQADDVRDARSLALTAGPIVDRNGAPVPDGLVVSFTLSRADGTVASASGKTSDGFAGAQVTLSGRGRYTATASAGGVTSKALAINVTGEVAPEPPTPERADTPAAANDAGGLSALVLALIVGVPSVLLAAAGAAAGVVVYRRRAADAPVPADATERVEEKAAVPADPPALLVDGETRRVYVKGTEARPPLSSEQFRLLSYLYQRAGKVVPREELVQQVWPDAHMEGVSEEALDALVRRVRERIVQAGGERSYIVTLRGQGFRLDV